MQRLDVVDIEGAGKESGDREELGNVRPEKVKRIARELLRLYPDKFTADFEENKKIIMSLARIPSAKLRNRIVGYITSQVAIMQAQVREQSQ